MNDKLELNIGDCLLVTYLNDGVHTSVFKILEIKESSDPDNRIINGLDLLAKLDDYESFETFFECNIERKLDLQIEDNKKYLKIEV